MSGEQFLRAHGWKLGRNLWWHDRLPEQGHQFDVALLQQAQWLAADVHELRVDKQEYVQAVSAHIPGDGTCRICASLGCQSHER